MKNKKVIFANLSDVGKVRKANEDYFGYYDTKYGNLAIVCDGMGGHIGGAIASEIAVMSIKDYFISLSSQPQNTSDDKTIPDADNLKIELSMLKGAIQTANENIIRKGQEDPQLSGMGSTAVVILVTDKKVYYAHVGDSRIYRVRGGEIKQLTKDHSLVQQMVDGGMITVEDAKHHPRKNIITRALGTDSKVEPDLNECEIYKNDVYVLCSDGLTGHVEDNEILSIIDSNKPSKAVTKLVKLANDRGGKDNITVQLVRTPYGLHLPIKKRLNTNLMFYTALGLFVAALFVALWTFGIFTNNGSENKDLIPKSDSNPVKMQEIKTETKPQINQDADKQVKDSKAESNNSKAPNKDVKKDSKIKTEGKKPDNNSKAK